MSEYRQEPLSRRWVIIGTERAGRPNEFLEPLPSRQPIPCPFCAGNERETPDAVAVYKKNGRGWLARVVPNKFPAVQTATVLGGGALPLGSIAPAGAVPGFGRHEVIIESPRHVASLSELTVAEAEVVFRAYRDRIRDLKADGSYQYVQIFKNVGSAAGASLEHVHSQLMALPGVPEVVETELSSSGDYFAQHGRSLLVDLIAAEVAQEERIVAQSERFVAFCPYASRFGYEVWVAPLAHQSRYESLQDGEFGEFAQLMQDVIGRIERASGQTAYNYYLHTQPFDMRPHDHYHWHIEIVPRLTKVAGFEWSTGCFINPYPPEAAAAHLRASPARPA
ncbi:MAG: galactose-1-phosphate uridylyltransferase [Pirellulaceae bacterium]|nr:galactose-1-phosphate uridylyltransferase [Pirellulaceae bacterium]